MVIVKVEFVDAILLLMTAIILESVEQTQETIDLTVVVVELFVVLDKIALMDSVLVDVLLELQIATMMEFVKQTQTLIH